MMTKIIPDIEDIEVEIIYPTVDIHKLMKLRAEVRVQNQRCENDSNYGHDHGPSIISVIHHWLEDIIKE